MPYHVRLYAIRNRETTRGIGVNNKRNRHRRSRHICTPPARNDKPLFQGSVITLELLPFHAVRWNFRKLITNPQNSGQSEFVDSKEYN